VPISKEQMKPDEFHERSGDGHASSQEGRTLGNRVRTPAADLAPDHPSSRESHRRAVQAQRRVRNALREARLFLYAERTLHDPAIRAGMRSIAEHLEAGRSFENARPVKEYVAGTARETRPGPACEWEPSDALEAWLSDQSLEVVSGVLDFLFELCEHPDVHTGIQLEEEPTQRQFALVPNTDAVIITYAVTAGDPCIVHGLKMERDTRFWTP
jgi:hypothetical protein